MGGDNVKKILRDNVLALMQERWGEENINRLARDTGIGVGSAQRIKEAETSVGIEIVEKVAKHFKVPAFALLCPPGKQKGLLTILQAYSESDERGREFLIGTAEATLLRRADKTGTSD